MTMHKIILILGVILAIGAAIAQSPSTIARDNRFGTCTQSDFRDARAYFVDSKPLYAVATKTDSLKYYDLTSEKLIKTAETKQGNVVIGHTYSSDVYMDAGKEKHRLIMAVDSVDAQGQAVAWWINAKWFAAWKDGKLIDIK